MVVHKINIGTSMTFKKVINGFSKNKNKLNFIIIILVVLTFWNKVCII